MERTELLYYTFYYEDIGCDQLQVDCVSAYSIADAEITFSLRHPTATWWEIELPDSEVENAIPD